MIDAVNELPSEILTIILKELLPQDLVSCGRTCWVWNTIANQFLYETVYICSEYRHQLFVRSINPCRNHDGSCVCKPCNRRKQLGQLVKAVDIDIDYSTAYEEIFDDFTVALLLELASATPNVHTAKTYMPILTGEIRNGSYLDWNILAARWTKLTSLTLRETVDGPAVQGELTNFSNILSRIQHLEFTACLNGLTFMLPFLRAQPCLQFLMANISDSEDYEALREISQTCRNTLHTLIMDLLLFGNTLYIDLDDFNIANKLLKTVGIKTHVDDFHIKNFGDNLEQLEWWSTDLNRGNSIMQAMKRTNKLKTLSLVEEMTLGYIPSVLEANKSTLHTFYFRAYDPWENEGLIPLLLANKMQLCNVTTLFFEFGIAEDSDVQSLAEIFPNVEFLGLTRDSTIYLTPMNPMSSSGRVPSRWITAGDLSHFRHLKAIDQVTYLEVIDQNAVTYQKCIIPWDKFWVPPSKKTTVF
jgi:hypothetical protein